VSDVDSNIGVVSQDAQILAKTQDYRQRVLAAIDRSRGNSAIKEYRRTATDQFAALADAVWDSKQGSGKKRKHAHIAQRAASATSAVAAGSSGVALAAGLGGTAANWLALVVVIFGLAGLAVAAIWPAAEYERNQAKASHYAALWRDIWAYATLTLPDADKASIASQLKRFNATEQAVHDGRGG
jgi:hypothetical protein